MNRPLEVKEELPSRRQAVELQRDRLESTLYVKVQSVDGKRKLWFSWRKKTSHCGRFWWNLQSLTGKLQGRITTQGDPCSHYREWVYRVQFSSFLVTFLSLCYQHWNCCSSSCNMYRELPNHTTGFKGLLWYPVIFTGSLQGRITTQGDPCSHYRDWVCSVLKNVDCLKGYVKDSWHQKNQ